MSGCCFQSCVTFSLTVFTAVSSCLRRLPSSAIGSLKSLRDRRASVRSRPIRDFGLLKGRLLVSTHADGSTRISRKQSRAPRRWSPFPAFVYFLGVSQGPE